MSQKLRGKAHVSVHTLVFMMSVPASYSVPAPAWSQLLYVWLFVCIGLLLGLDRLRPCFYFPSFSWGKECCDIVSGVAFYKCILLFGGVYELFWTGGAPFVCSQSRRDCMWWWHLSLSVSEVTAERWWPTFSPSFSPARDKVCVCVGGLFLEMEFTD